MTPGGHSTGAIRQGDANAVRTSFHAAAVFSVLLVALVYSNALQGPLIFDDIPHIVENQAIRLTKIDAAGLWRAAFHSPHPNRPVANVSFALNYRFHRLAVPGYHVTNIFIHLITGLLFYWLAAHTLALTASPARTDPLFVGIRDRMTALAASTLWMVHPLQTQSVTYTVQRMNALAALFYLLAFQCYLRGRTASEERKRIAFYAATVLSGLMAVGSKEIAATLPLFLFLYEWFFFRNLDRCWLRRQWPWLAALAAAGVGIGWIYLGKDPLARVLASYGQRNFSLGERLLTEPRVILLYLSLLIFPHPGRLNLDHHITVSRSLISPPTTLAAMILLAALFLFALAGARRHRLLSFAVLWYLGNLVLESSVIGLELAFEHRNYLPSMFLFLAAVRWAVRRFSDRRILAVVLGFVILVLGLWTFQRNAVWRSDLTLWQDCAVKSPRKPRPHNKLGFALERRGRLAEAEAAYRRVLDLAPGHGYAHFNLANILVKQGRLREAVAQFQKCLMLLPDYPKARLNLGVALAVQGKDDEALAQFSAIRPRAGPCYGIAQKNMGLMRMSVGDAASAAAHFQNALTVFPKDPVIRQHRRTALKKSEAGP